MSVESELRRFATCEKLPRPVEEIVLLERAGAVVDLETGEVFEPRDNWWDFCRRWCAERKRRGEPLTVEAFAPAVQRACGPGATWQGCRAIAAATLGLIAREEREEAALPV